MVLDPDALLAGLAGGILIGLASAMLLLLNGRIAGISGIAGSLLAAPGGAEGGERVAFLAGLVGVPLLWSLTAGAPGIVITDSVPLLLAGGLLVGIGTRLGGGCTSGHGVCGLSRLSLRSLVATGAFMLVAGLVTGTARHLAGG